MNTHKQNIKSALEASKWKEHTMILKNELSIKNRKAFYECKKCEAIAIIKLTRNLMPNDCEVTGNAIAIYCEKNSNK